MSMRRAPETGRSFGQDNLDTVIEESVPVEPVGNDDQINQAQVDGDWQTSSNLKAEKLRALTQKQ